MHHQDEFDGFFALSSPPAMFLCVFGCVGSLFWYERVEESAAVTMMCLMWRGEVLAAKHCFDNRTAARFTAAHCALRPIFKVILAWACSACLDESVDVAFVSWGSLCTEKFTLFDVASRCQPRLCRRPCCALPPFSLSICTLHHLKERVSVITVTCVSMQLPTSAPLKIVTFRYRALGRLVVTYCIPPPPSFPLLSAGLFSRSVSSVISVSSSHGSPSTWLHLCAAVCRRRGAVLRGSGISAGDPLHQAPDSRRCAALPGAGGV